MDNNKTEDISIFQRFVDKKIGILKGDCKNSDLYEIRGICRSIDGYLNVALENCIFKNISKPDEEILENKVPATISSAKLKTCFVTGNSLKHIWLIGE